MSVLKRSVVLIFVLSIFSGCATKIIEVKIPEASEVGDVQGYVKIEEINDLRKFERSPSEASTPSIEGDFIDDKAITDKTIGRMRHGLYHKALWNYSIKGDDDIYDVCRNVVEVSLAGAGYVLVDQDSDKYDEAWPVAIDILQFWAWMQPKFNIDLHFDGELQVRSLSSNNKLNVDAEGHHMFSTGFAGGGAWTRLVEEGVKDLNQNLTSTLKGETK